MIVLLGASGYVGTAFARELTRRKMDFIPLSRKNTDYTNFETLLKFLAARKPALVINAAGFTGRPNVDACELAKADTLAGTTLLPQTVAQACATLDLPWAHVSSGCIFNGAKIADGKTLRVETDLTRPELKALAEKSPDKIRGFTETDEPNFSFRRPPCSFYSGAKALAEEAVAGIGRGYLWRMRIPFDEFDHDRYYLSKLQRYPKIYDNTNSISHRGDFVRACLDLWERNAPFGIYNVTNPGFITTRQVVGRIEKILKPDRRFEFWKDDKEFYRLAVKTPRSNCVLDVSKLLATGVEIRPVEEAIEDSLKNWRPEL